MKIMHLLIAALILPSMFNLGQPVRTEASGAQQSATQQPKTTRNLAILIFDGVQIIDYTGPYETFGHVYSEPGPAFNIYTVSEKSGAIQPAWA